MNRRQFLSLTAGTTKAQIPFAGPTLGLVIGFNLARGYKSSPAS